MVADVEHWLESHGLENCAELFIKNEIDLDAARDLTEADLREIGFAMGPRKKLLRAIAQLRGEQDDSSPPSKLEQSSGERRQVTVLFADVSGYTRLASERDAEDIHNMLEMFFGEADRIIAEFGGSVDKHVGDCVMAVFGAPVAHSNDPERAVRSALAIHDAMPRVSEKAGTPVTVHIGIASGQVVASGVGGDSHYTVTGASVNLASRLTDAAGPGETYISANVERSVKHLCTCEDLGVVSLKGMSAPVPYYRLLSIGSFDGSEHSGPFVGRHSELEQMRAILSACFERKTGQVVYIRGEAGIGKTRLTEEFEKLAIEKRFEIHRALILDFGVGKGQDAVRSLVRSLLRIPKQSGKEVRRKAALQAIEEELISGIQSVFLNDLLDLPQTKEMQSIYDAMDNATRNEGKLETFARLVRQICLSRPLVLIVENVHWANDLIMTHLVSLANAVADIPVLLVMTSRVEGDRWDSNWRAIVSSTPFFTLDLTRLRHEDALTLAGKLFSATNQFTLSCIDRAEGNPLFLEQLLRGAEATAEGRVPGSVQSIVQARMDALPQKDKTALQAASVLGQRFSLDAMRYLIQEDGYECSTLVAKYLVRPDGDQYLFAHALVQEGVYDSLLTSTKRDLHQRAAGWYRDGDLRLCAEHLDRAGDPEAPAAYLDAARAEAERLRFETVLQLARRGWEIAEGGPVKCDLLLLLAEASLNTGATEQAITAFKTAIEHACDDKQKALAWSGLAGAFRVADKHQNAMEALNHAEDLALNLKLDAELAQIHYLRGNVYFPLGRVDECLREHKASLELARKVSSSKGEAQALSGIGDALYLQGRMRTACDRFKECVDLSREQGYGRIEVANRHMVGWTRFYMMEFREALDDALAVQKLAAEVSHRRAELLGLMLAGVTEIRLGNLDNSIEHLKAATALATRIGANNFLAQTKMAVGKAHSLKGNREKAFRHIQEAVEIIRNAGSTFVGPTVLAHLAAISDNAAQKEKALDEAEAILDSGCVAHNHFWFAESAIDTALQAAKWDKARRFADRLENYTKREPLPWSDFIIERARALADWGMGKRSQETEKRLKDLRSTAAKAGLVSAIYAIDAALTN